MNVRNERHFLYLHTIVVGAKLSSDSLVNFDVWIPCEFSSLFDFRHLDFQLDGWFRSSDNDLMINDSTMHDR